MEPLIASNLDRCRRPAVNSRWYAGSGPSPSNKPNNRELNKDEADRQGECHRRQIDGLDCS